MYDMIEPTLWFDDVGIVPDLLLPRQLVQRSHVQSRKQSERWPWNEARAKKCNRCFAMVQVFPLVRSNELAMDSKGLSQVVMCSYRIVLSLSSYLDGMARLLLKSAGFIHTYVSKRFQEL